MIITNTSAPTKEELLIMLNKDRSSLARSIKPPTLETSETFWYVVGRKEGVTETIDRVLEIIDEDIGEHIYRDAFRTRADLEKLYDRVRSHVEALKEG